MDARVERLTLELENKDTLIAELGLVPDRSNPHLDKLGNTWHGFRTVSPLFSELAQADNLTAHPSLVGGKNSSKLILLYHKLNDSQNAIYKLSARAVWIMIS